MRFCTQWAGFLAEPFIVRQSIPGKRSAQKIAAPCRGGPARPRKNRGKQLPCLEPPGKKRAPCVRRGKGVVFAGPIWYNLYMKKCLILSVILWLSAALPGLAWGAADTAADHPPSDDAAVQPVTKSYRRATRASDK